MSDIENYLKRSLLSHIVVFDELQIPSLTLCVSSSYSSRHLTSYIRGTALHYNAFFALNLVQSLYITNSTAEYVEFEKRSKIFNVVGDWKTHIDRLTAHEIAHIIDLSAPFDKKFGSRIQEKFGVELIGDKRRQHHGKLWRMIYTYLISGSISLTNDHRSDDHRSDDHRSDDRTTTRQTTFGFILSYKR
jgi:hypothetical protein